MFKVKFVKLTEKPGKDRFEFIIFTFHIFLLLPKINFIPKGNIRRFWGNCAPRVTPLKVLKHLKDFMKLGINIIQLQAT